MTEPPRGPVLARLQAAAALHLWLLLPALAGALPLAFAVGSLWGHFPSGDALLWHPGGFFLAETLRLLGRDLAALGRAAAWLWGAWALCGLIPQGFILATLPPEAPRRVGDRLAQALSSLPSLTFVMGLTLLARIAALLLCIALNKGLEPAIAGLSDRARDLEKVVVVLLALALLGLVRIWHDASAAAVLWRSERGAAALLTGLGVLHRSFLPAVFSWGWRALLGGALALGSLRAGASLGIEGASFWLTVLLHQAALFALAWMRVGWLVQVWGLTPRPSPEIPDGGAEPESGEEEGAG